MDNPNSIGPQPLPLVVAARDDEPSDAWLAQQAQAGCVTSFEQLVVRHTPRLMRFLLRRTGHRHDAEDLVQETWARAYRFLQHYRPAQSFSAWLWTIGARLDVSRRRKKTLPLAAWHDDLAMVPSEGGQELVEQERRDGLWALAQRWLSPLQREALWLFYVEELSIKDVARVLNISTVSAKVMLYRARRRLGDALRQNRGAEAIMVGCREGAEI